MNSQTISSIEPDSSASPLGLSRRGTLLGALALSLTSLGGCTTPEEMVEETDQAVVVDFTAWRGNGVSRLMRMDCPMDCHPADVDPNNRRNCLRPVSRCGPENFYAFYASLHADPEQREALQPFTAFDDGRGEGYQGCGPHAAANVAAYVGLDIPVSTIKGGWVDVLFDGRVAQAFQGNIATLPDKLSRGIDSMFQAHGIPLRAHLHSGAEWARWATENIKSGLPVIILAENGSHWLTATGYRRGPGGDQFYVIDYPWQAGRWVPIQHLGADTITKVADVLGNPGDWRKRTIIRIVRSNPLLK